MSESPPFRGRHVTLPLGSLDAQLAFLQTNITPFERHNFTAPQPGVASQQDDEVRIRIR
jgi:hypothetical protein